MVVILEPLKAQTKPSSCIQPLSLFYSDKLLQKGGSIKYAKTVETNAEGSRQKGRRERGDDRKEGKHRMKPNKQGLKKTKQTITQRHKHSNKR